MLFDDLPLLEAQFRQTGQDGEYTLRPLAVPVPGETLTLDGLLCLPVRRSGYYYATTYPKQRIVLHFTVGNLPGDIGALTRQDRHVSVPFVIARDGTIYQLFASRFWSGHLGADAVGNRGTGNAQDKATIGIELSNYGPLRRQSEVLETVYEGPYCTVAQSVAYQQLTTPFRAETYFATFTEAQYDSLVVLLRYLTAQYRIPRQFLPAPKRYQTPPDVVNFRGIVSHVNYRSGGKWDIGPAFNWARVIRAVQAPAFAQPNRRTRELDERALTSENELIPLLPAPAPPDTENDPYDETTDSTQ